MPTATQPRPFGVEVECGFIDPELPAQPTKQRGCGCERPDCQLTLPMNNDQHAAACLKRIRSCFESGMFSQDWSTKVHPGGMGGQAYDGTTVEFRVGPIAGDEGFEELTRFMDYLRENGGYVTRGDGMHVHFDGGGFYTDDKKGNEKADVLVDSWLNNRANIVSVLPARRVKPGYGRHPLTEKIVQSYKTTKRLGRYEVHLAASYGSIEFRIFQGTLNPTLATAWIRFGHALLDTCLVRDEPLPTYVTPRVFFEALGMQEADVATLLDYEDDVTGGADCAA